MEGASKFKPNKDDVEDNEDDEESTDDDIEASDDDDASECKDGDEANDESPAAERREKMKLLRKRSHHALSGRGITLAMLLTEGIIEPGTDFMSLDYLGQKFTADLLPDGRIKWKEEDTIFCSPSAWASHCKKMVNPDKKSGCGWSSVRYKGKKLDALKSCWFKKHRQMAQVYTDRFEKIDREEKENGESTPKKLKLSPNKMKDENSQATTHATLSIPVPQSSVGSARAASILTSPPNLQAQSVSISSSFNQSNLQQQQQLSPKSYNVVKHSSLGRVFTDHDRRTLVECTTFAALARIQPFNMSITSSCLAVIDFHSHQLNTEVLGYIGGKWDPTLQQLQLLKAYPIVRRATDEQSAANIEREIQDAMFGEGLNLVGWYHSHPNTSSNPSLADIEAQMAYQLLLKAPGNTYQPCVAVIVSPYESSSMKESSLTVYWVMPPSEQRPLEFGTPVSVEFCTQDEENNEKTRQTLLDTMSLIYNHCQKESSAINFADKWDSSTSFAEKLKVSLAKRLKDKLYKTVSEHVKTLINNEGHH